jgi:site-specific DNA-cytosine methylase
MAMESKMTAVEWLIDQVEQFHCLLPVDMIEQAKAMEKEQHGETWDMALKQMVERGYVWERAMIDFDDYWAEKSKTPPGAHCEEA